MKLSLVQSSKNIQGIVQRHQVQLTLLGRRDSLIEGKGQVVCATLGGVVLSCMVHQNLPHEVGGHGKKVCAIVQSQGLLLYESQISFVHQCSALQRMAGALGFEVVMGKAPELVINER